MLILYPGILVNLCISSSGYYVESLEQRPLSLNAVGSDPFPCPHTWIFARVGPVWTLSSCWSWTEVQCTACAGPMALLRASLLCLSQSIATPASTLLPGCKIPPQSWPAGMDPKHVLGGELQWSSHHQRSGLLLRPCLSKRQQWVPPPNLDSSPGWGCFCVLQLSLPPAS